MNTSFSKREECANMIKAMAAQVRMPAEIIKQLDPLAEALKVATDDEVNQLFDGLIKLKMDFDDAVEKNLHRKSFGQALDELQN